MSTTTLYSSLTTRAYQPTAGLTSTYPQTEVKDHLTSLGVTLVCKSPPVIVGFLDQDYHYRSVAIQIPHDAGLAPVHSAGLRPGSSVCKTVTLLLCYGGRPLYGYLCLIINNIFIIFVQSKFYSGGNKM